MGEYQGNKLFKEGDTVYFDPLFKRIRDTRNKENPTPRYKKGISAIKKSLNRKTQKKK